MQCESKSTAIAKKETLTIKQTNENQTHLYPYPTVLIIQTDNTKMNNHHPKKQQIVPPETKSHKFFENPNPLTKKTKS